MVRAFRVMRELCKKWFVILVLLCEASRKCLILQSIPAPLCKMCSTQNRVLTCVGSSPTAATDKGKAHSYGCAFFVSYAGVMHVLTCVMLVF